MEALYDGLVSYEGTTKMKMCTKCGLCKPILEFHLTGGGKREARCKVCSSIQHKECYKKRKDAFVLSGSCSNLGEGNTASLFKLCTFCGLEKHLSQFHKQGIGDTRSSQCASCISIKTRERYRRQKEELALSGPMQEDLNILNLTKVCTKCGEEKDLLQFDVHRLGKRSAECKACSKIRHAALAQKNKDSFVFPDKSGMKKVCSSCKVEKLGVEFSLSRRRSDGLDNICKSCKSVRTRDLECRKRYGLTKEEVDFIFSRNPCCNICGNIFNSSVVPNLDHDHKTGKVRGVLCHLCNSALGFLEDSPDTIRSAIEYLRAFQDRQSSSDISA
jgi:hypothetical protein